MTARESRQLAALFDDGPPEDRGVRRARACVVLAQEVARLRGELVALCRHFHASVAAWIGTTAAGDPPAVDFSIAAVCRLCIVTAVVTIAVDGVFAVYAAAMLLTLPRAAAAAVGLLIAVAMTLLSKVGLALASDPKLPKMSFRRAARIAIGAVTASMLLLAFLLWQRSVIWSAVTLPVTLSAIGVVFPFTGAALWEAARLLGERNRLARRYAALEDELHRTEALLAIAEEGGGNDPTGGRGTESGPSGSGLTSVKRAVGVLLAFGALALAPASGCVADAIAAAATNGATTGDVAIGRPIERVLLYTDVSPSVDSAVGTRVWDELCGDPRAFVEAFGTTVRTVGVVAFASAADVWRSAAVEVEWPRYRVVEPPPLRDEEADIFTLERDERARRAAEAATAARARADREYLEAVGAALARVRQTIRDATPATPTLRTCVGDALARAATAPPGSLTVLVTDSVQARCGKLDPAPPPRGEATVVLVPARTDGEALYPRSVERVRLLRRIAPGFRVVPWYALEASWTALRHEHAARPEDRERADATVRRVADAPPGVDGMLRHVADEQPLVGALTGAPAPGRHGSLSISTPADGAHVGLTELVRGGFDPANGVPSVYVHPANTMTVWWRQRPATPVNERTWQVLAQFGTPEGEGRNEYFEVVGIQVPPGVAVPEEQQVRHDVFTRLLVRVPHTSILTVYRTR
jgi:hypothetical protein